MAHTFAAVYVHVIFSTKGRERWLTGEVREGLFPYMGGIVREVGGVSMRVNGVEDHVHMLVKVPPVLAVADLVRDVKANSSSWVKERYGRAFGWQTGYGAFSVSKSGVEEVLSYIARQEEHHRGWSFEEEYLGFLRKHEVEFDERFVFD